jgi:RPA family protein
MSLVIGEKTVGEVAMVHRWRVRAQTASFFLIFSRGQHDCLSVIPTVQLINFIVIIVNINYYHLRKESNNVVI